MHVLGNKSDMGENDKRDSLPYQCCCVTQMKERKKILVPCPGVRWVVLLNQLCRVWACFNLIIFSIFSF